jgi:hypothetical protein
MIDNFLGNVERFLRWIYPGLLFLVVFHLGTVDGLKQTLLRENSVLNVQPVFGLLALVVVSGTVIYALQRHCVNEFLQLVFFVFKQGAVFYLYCTSGNNKCKDWRHRLKPWVFWEYSSKAQIKRFGNEQNQQFRAYMTYSWSMNHALGLSSWVIPLGYMLSDSRSEFKQWGSFVWVLTAVFFVIWVWQFCHNTQGDKRVLEKSKSDDPT